MNLESAFKEININTLVASGHYAEILARGQIGLDVAKILVIGQHKSTKTVDYTKPVLITSADDGYSKFGVSQLGKMLELAFTNNIANAGEVYALPVAEPTGDQTSIVTCLLKKPTTTTIFTLELNGKTLEYVYNPATMTPNDLQVAVAKDIVNHKLLLTATVVGGSNKPTATHDVSFDVTGTLSDFEAITDGEFNIKVDGYIKPINAIDFHTVTAISSLGTAIAPKLTGWQLYTIDEINGNFPVSTLKTAWSTGPIAGTVNSVPFSFQLTTAQLNEVVDATTLQKVANEVLNTVGVKIEFILGTGTGLSQIISSVKHTSLITFTMTGLTQTATTSPYTLANPINVSVDVADTPHTLDFTSNGEFHITPSTDGAKNIIKTGLLENMVVDPLPFGLKMVFETLHTGLSAGELNVNVTTDDPSNTVTLTKTQKGLLNPTLELTDLYYSYYLNPFTDQTNILHIGTLQKERFDALVMKSGRVISTFKGAIDSGKTFAENINNPHVAILYYTGLSPAYEYTASAGARHFFSLSKDPTLPTSGYDVLGISTPKKALSITEQNLLINSGLSPYMVTASETVITDQLLSTYTKNNSGAVDKSYKFLGIADAYERARRLFTQNIAVAMDGKKMAKTTGEASLEGSETIITVSTYKDALIDIYDRVLMKQLDWFYDLPNFINTLQVEYNETAQMFLWQGEWTLLVQMNTSAGQIVKG